MVIWTPFSFFRWGAPNRTVSRKGNEMKKNLENLLNEIMFVLFAIGCPALVIWIIFNGYPF